MSNQSAIQSWAKLSVSRPNAAINELKAVTPAARERVIRELRVYPAALMGLLRADFLPRDWKVVIEEELADAGFTMMT